MTTTKGALSVDLAGLRQLVERRGKAFALLELVQNAWDEPGVTQVSITLEPDGSRRALLTISDDAPEGFADLRHAYTLFASSRKRGNAEQRGRFNLGEKLVIALSESFEVKTTKGTVVIDVRNNTRKTSSAKRAHGSVIRAVLRMNRAEMDEAAAAFRTLIAPKGIQTSLYLDGSIEELPTREPIATFEATLQTELAEGDGVIRKTKRKTTVAVYEPAPGETASLYEMGIPVVETEDRWHVDVGQKVPLNVDRDNVPPAFLRDVRALVLNAMAAHLTAEDASATWVSEAIEDELVDGDAVNAVLDRRFGAQRVVVDPSDLEANRIALSEGYTVIPSNTFSRDGWKNVRRFEAVLPAGKVTPSPKPFSPDGTPLNLIAREDMTVQQREFADECALLHKRLIGRDLSVELTNEPGWGFNGCYSRTASRMIVNMASVAPSLDNENTLSTVLHEFGHFYGDHLTHAFDDGIARVAARLVLITRKEARGK